MGRASYELKADESEVIRAKFNTTSNPLYNSPHPTPVQLLTHARNAKEFCAWKAQHPSILEHFDDFTSLLHGKRLAVFLDYDGTLTPIVKDPDRAFMPEQMRAAVRKVAQLFPTSIISGRGREKVEGFVQLKELFYAGSHGMDIVGPKANNASGDEQRLSFQPAAKYAPIMDSVFQSLTHRVQEIPGASVEHNKFCVSVHFRNCSPDSYDAVVVAVKDTLHDHSNLKASRGRKVLEIQPQVDWGKGRALSHMLKALSLDDCDDVIPIYLGDDRTDEDAFKVLKQRGSGFGVLISNKMKETAAKYTLTDPNEVMAFLTHLVEWGDTPDNAWHTHHSCTGWSLKQQTPSHAPPPPPAVPVVPTASSHISTDRPNGLNTGVTLDGESQRHSSGHWQRDREQSSLTSSFGSSPGHSPNSGSAFATVRQFRGLPVAAGTSDRAMPASQWLIKTDAFSQPKPDHALAPVDTAPSEAAAVCPEGACKNQAGSNQQDTAEDEYSQMGFVKEGLSDCDQQEAEAAGTGSIEAEGRPPTAAAYDEEGSAPPARSSQDHYLNQTVKPAEGNHADDGMAPASHMGRWDNAVTESSLTNSPHQPKQAAKSDKGIPNGKRLTALLLDKLEGHEGHHASEDDDDDASPPGISNDGESSLAGYQSPFELLANEAVLEEADSVKAEDGSVKSLNMAPSM
ncbi:hypothetical protein WJX77_004146 [Trebouxia sp. C0004]